MTFHQIELRAVRNDCEEQCANVVRVCSERNQKRKNDDTRRRRNNIADGILIAGIGISVYFAFYGLAAFLQWCATGRWI